MGAADNVNTEDFLWPIGLFLFFACISHSASKKEDPRWSMVDVKFERMLKRYIPLSELKSLHLKHKASAGPLANLALFTRARLSVQPLAKGRSTFILLYWYWNDVKIFL